MSVVKYGPDFSSDTNRKPSGTIWRDCQWNEIAAGDVDGVVFWDDFQDFGLPGTQTTEINLSRYKVYNTGAGNIIFDDMPHSTTPATGGGIISMLCDTNGDQSVIGTQACPFSLSTTLTGKVWVEARIATTSILTNMGQLFFGLAENSVMTYGAAIPLADANATAAGPALIGFNRLEDGLAVLNTSYADHAATWTDIQAAANASPLTQIVANTWIKLGMKFDFTNPTSTNVGTFFVNGQECTTKLTRTTLSGLTHVDAKALGLCLAFFADSAGTADYVYLDWWKAAQTF